MLDAAVPTCPGWTVGDLVRHLGATSTAGSRLHVARGDRRAGAPSGPRTRRPPSGVDLVAWWTERYAEIMSLLDALDPDLPAWNWAPQAKMAGFWHRRMAHETAVHRWDAQMAAGLAEPLEASSPPTA